MKTLNYILYVISLVLLCALVSLWQKKHWVSLWRKISLQRVGLRFLEWFCPNHLLEEIEGDLVQRFERDVKRLGVKRARRRFVWNAIRFFRPGILLRNKFSMKINHVDMLLHHLKFSIRLFRKDKFFSVLNVLGLTMGISVGIVLLLILQNDFTYDQHYTNHRQIFRLGSHYQVSGVDEEIAYVAREIGPILKEEFPDIQAIIPIRPLERTLVRSGTKEIKRFYEEKIIQTDSNYFHAFNHDFIAGDPETCLKDRYSVVLTSSMAKKYFGDADPLSQSLVIDQVSWTITAIIHDVPETTHLKFDMILSGLPDHRDWTMANGKPVSEAFWNPEIYMYLLVPTSYSPQDFYRKWPSIYARYFKETGDQVGGQNAPILERLVDIHLYSELQDGESHGNLTFLYAFIAVGALILVLACINYMNLSTAKAVNRATEIAIKKISGSGKRVLVYSILSESVLLSLISLVLALILVFGIVESPAFSQLIGRKLTMDLFHNRLLLVGSLGITFTIGLISGLYPAIYLTGIPAVASLKGKFKNRKSAIAFRRFSITVQFAISIFVIYCTLFMREQINFIQTKDLGFNKNNLLILPVLDSMTFKNLPAAKTELLRNPNIEAITSAANVMGLGMGEVMYCESATGMKEEGGILAMFVGDDYLKTMGLELIMGRDFRPGEDADTGGAYIANESTVKLMGWGEEAVGKKVSFWRGENLGNVIGVVKDFNVNSLHQGVDPMFIIKGHWSTGYFQIRLTGEDIPETIEYIKDKWTWVDPNHPFEYFFLDQRFNEQYKGDVIQNKLLSRVSGICIFISLLGLVGLSAFTATQRTKEIGVRKVLGADLPDIMFLLSREVLLLVVFAAVLTVPFSWWAIQRWMEGFAYKTDLNYFTYPAVTAVALAAVFLTIIFQSLKTARADPVESLKCE